MAGPIGFMTSRVLQPGAVTPAFLLDTLWKPA
jgi:hypothetical protein